MEVVDRSNNLKEMNNFIRKDEKQTKVDNNEQMMEKYTSQRVSELRANGRKK